MKKNSIEKKLTLIISSSLIILATILIVMANYVKDNTILGVVALFSTLTIIAVGNLYLKKIFIKPMADMVEYVTEIRKSGQIDLSHLVPLKYKKCWEVKECNKTDCPGYKSNNLACWSISGTFCNGMEQGHWTEKRENCSKCEVFKKAIGNEIDELGDGFNSLLAEINDVVATVSRASAGIASAALEMASSIEEMSLSTKDIATGVEVQASASEESSSSMINMDRSIREISEGTTNLDKLAEGTKQQADFGGKALENIITNIGQIEGDSSKIAGIVSVIGEIASQTNLLALNAAIEAAKAGEEGKGFAVVAEEVRKLAERSAESAKEISNLITGNTQTIKSGVKLAGEAGKSFEGIITGINDTANFIKEISILTERQSVTSTEVAKAIDELASTSEKNAASVEELSHSTVEIESAANELSGMAENLKELVEKFKLT